MSSDSVENTNRMLRDDAKEYRQLCVGLLDRLIAPAGVVDIEVEKLRVLNCLEQTMEMAAHGASFFANHFQRSDLEETTILQKKLMSTIHQYLETSPASGQEWGCL